MKNQTSDHVVTRISFLNGIGLSKTHLKLLSFTMFLWALFPLSAAMAENSSPKTEYNWHITAYIGTLVQNDMDEIVLQQETTFSHNHLVVMALARDVYKSKKWIGVELEGLIGKHFGADNEQWEFAGLTVARWYPFPWDRYIDTSFAAGAGLSYYSEISKTELAKNVDAQRLLGYLMLELTFGLPQYTHWNLGFRLHHRSGINSIIGESGSNYLCGGVRVTF
jgi:hypothetical protein